MSVFDVDFEALIKQLLPVRLRQVISISWLKCITAPVVWLYDQFIINRNNNLYVLAHDSQVCYLEALLNDTFDPISRRIFITDPVFIDPIYIYEVIESKPVFLDLASEIGTGVINMPDPLPLYLDAELYTGGGYGFIVNVPVALGLTVSPGPIKRLRALADMYRLPGKLYNVVFF